MGNELTKTDDQSGVSGTRSFSVTLNLGSSIPAWVNLPALDGSDLYGYAGHLPANCAGELIAAAHQHHLALAPADPEDARKTLRGLRVATIITNEDALEADATLKMLRVHLADVPLDILSEACRAYCNAPGKRFFPKSAGELRAFINPLIFARTARAYRLERLAKRAHDEQAERERLAADPLTPDAVASIMAEFGLGDGALRDPAPSRAAPAEQAEASIDQYLALGLSEAEARAAIEQRRRLLSRGRAKPVGDFAGGVIADVADAAEQSKAA